MLKEKLKNHTIILASGSPRRQQFFKDLHIDFTIQLKEVEEIYPKHLKGAEITNYLADLKSKAFTKLEENEVLITSDTIVWHKNKALGKPKHAEEAKEMLLNLSDTSHEVITSISIKTNNSQSIISDTTKVYFKKLTEKEIDFYITTYKPFDKAGAYGIQEWIGLIGIKYIEGSYFNVVGLPTEKLYKELMNL
jgi:septum formation protein